VSGSLTFRGDWARVLWSETSPNEGDPTCLCSYCGAWIPDGTCAVRCWRGKGERQEEARFCNDCAELCLGIKSVAPDPDFDCDEGESP